MRIKKVTLSGVEQAAACRQILALTRGLSAVYPGYADWFYGRFVPGLKKNERACIVAQDDAGCLIGCALIKNTPAERKICTLFVRPDMRRRGIGERLLRAAVKELGERPMMTVSGMHLKQMVPLLMRYGFRPSGCRKGIYRPGDTEYYFNDPTAVAVQNSLIPVLIRRMAQIRGK